MSIRLFSASAASQLYVDVEAVIVIVTAPLLIINQGNCLLDSKAACLMHLCNAKSCVEGQLACELAPT